MSAEPTGVMFTSTATAPAATAKTFFGLGAQPWLLAHSIIARPRPHSPMDTYMMTLAGSSPRRGKPALDASSVSGSLTGKVAGLGTGAVAHSPTNATPSSPRTLSVIAGRGRARGLCARTLITRPISASTRPPGMGGSASLGAGGDGAGGGGADGDGASGDGAGGAVTVETRRLPALSRLGGSTSTVMRLLLRQCALDIRCRWTR